METETISSRNAVELLLLELFGTGICPTAVNMTEETATERESEFVYGWDC